MKQNLHQIFKNMSEIEPNSNLEGFILAKIEQIKYKQAKKRLFFSYFGLVSSAGTFVLAIFGYGRAFLQSEFWVLSKLILTDAGVVFSNLNEYTFSLLETFPVVSAIIILTPITVLLYSFSIYFKSNRLSRLSYV